MPAKKAAKPAAKKAATKSPAKKAAKKTTTQKAQTEATTPPAQDVEVSAYLKYRERVDQGLPHDPLEDWLAAERSRDI
jgi:BRCT domain type II-containing protein